MLAARRTCSAGPMVDPVFVAVGVKRIDCRSGILVGMETNDRCGSPPADLFERVVAIGTGRAEVVVISEVVP
jgi:hypothetical protein